MDTSPPPPQPQEPTLAEQFEAAKATMASMGAELRQVTEHSQQIEQQLIEAQLTVNVLTDQLANSVKETTASRVHASKINMHAQNLQETVVRLQEHISNAAQQPQYAPPPAPGPIIENQPSSEKPEPRTAKKPKAS